VKEKTNLDYPLLKFSSNSQDWWTIRDAIRGVQIFGGIGSGKSSGSGKTIAKSFLSNGFGGLILCAKPDEKDNWVTYAKEVDREHDLIIFSEESGFEFNPLQYEITRAGKGAGEVFNLSNLFMELYKMGNRFSGGGSSGESERYWDNALRRCLNRTIQTLILAKQEISVQNMRKLVSSAPTEEEIEAMSGMSDEELIEWSNKNYCVACVMDGAGESQTEKEEEEHDLIYDYFMREFVKMPEKTRSTIEESFLGLAEPFMSGILKEYFSKGVNIRPEMTFDGKIIILDFSVKEYLQAGVYAQGIFKLLWQQATERREVDHATVPVFLWVDEAQLFISGYDQIFQTTARSSRACTVFISQNISNYYVAIGGKSPQARTDSLLGNLSTKIFHSNNDTVTNEWAAKTIGKAFRNVESISVGKGDSVGLSQQFHWQIEPREFTTLKNGGELNDYKVQGIITIAGRAWSNERNYIKKSFNQNL